MGNLMNVKDGKNIAREFFAAGNRGDMQRCMELIADDISWTDIGTTRFSGTYNGKQEIGENLLGPLFSQLKGGIHSTVERIIAEGNTVVVLSNGKAETIDGKQYNNTYCHVMTISDGQIREVIEYFDTALADRVFGEG